MLRAACWSWWTLRRLRRSLPVDGLRAEVPAPPRLPSGAGPGVLLGLRRASPTCLERALILQRWLAAHGAGRDVVIGVQAGGERLGAHAWIDGDEPESVAEYTELHRVPPP